MKPTSTTIETSLISDMVGAGCRVLSRIFDNLLYCKHPEGPGETAARVDSLPTASRSAKNAQ